MKEHIAKAKSFIFSGTAKDTGLLFVGNWLSAIWGLFFTLFVARAMSLAEFGIFSAAVNLVNILTSLSDIGISSGSVNFVAEHHAKNDHEKANHYHISLSRNWYRVLLGVSEGHIAKDCI